MICTTCQAEINPPKPFPGGICLTCFAALPQINRNVNTKMTAVLRLLTYAGKALTAKYENQTIYHDHRTSADDCRIALRAITEGK